MQKEIIFEQLERDEKIILLRAFNYDVDAEGYILTQNGNKIPSEDIPSKFIKVDEAALIPGSLKVIDGTPMSLSKFIRERVETANANRN